MSPNVEYARDLLPWCSLRPKWFQHSYRTESLRQVRLQVWTALPLLEPLADETSLQQPCIQVDKVLELQSPTKR